MRKILMFCVIVLFFLSPFKSWSQPITVNAQIDSSLMWIGNQTRLSFQISQQPGMKIVAPVFSDTIVGGLEIVESLKNDSVLSNDGHLLITQSYIVTAFDDSLIYIPPYPFVSDSDTVWTKSLSIKVVQPYVIDTTKNEIADIKPVLNTKFYWKGLIIKILIGLGVLLLLFIIYFLIRKYIQKKPIFDNGFKVPLLPAYDVAINKLDKIKHEKLWQHNRSKEFHTEITDVLREYIERTFEFNSPEMTSEEILSHLNHLRFESKAAFTSLEAVLKLADLVKFAKWDAFPEEHERSLTNAYLFVNETKVEEIINTEDTVEGIPENLEVK